MKDGFAKGGVMRRSIFKLLAASALALGASPVLAQNEDGAVEGGLGEAFDLEGILGGLLGDLYQPIPLTAEQDARLPEASAAAAVALPDGLYGRMMRQAIEGIVTPLTEKFATPSQEDLAGKVGVAEGDLPELDEGQRKRLGALLDPYAEERTRVMMGGVMTALETVFGHLEGPMREGLAKIYASRFTAPQLGEINAFLATPTGQVYASESLAAFTDPQMMGAMMRALPSVVTVLPQTRLELKTLEESVPAPRTYSDIPPADREELAAALGLTVEELQAGMARAAEGEADEWDWEDEAEPSCCDPDDKEWEEYQDDGGGGEGVEEPIAA